MTVAALLLFRQHFELSTIASEWIILIVFLSTMMISAVPYDWPKLELNENVFKKMQSMGLLIGLVLMAIFPGIFLFPLLLLYILSGLIHWLASLYRREVHISDFFMSIDKYR